MEAFISIPMQFSSVLAEEYFLHKFDSENSENGKDKALKIQLY